MVDAPPEQPSNTLESQTEMRLLISKGKWNPGSLEALRDAGMDIINKGRDRRGESSDSAVIEIVAVEACEERRELELEPVLSE